ncbi:hypothetical protein LTR36_007930 [Oleoguttula mirabilis]|uniref:Uncharacterized protein n=1 Tax=Oleoguttula mirabilis TaxID=1507867 RepID=A0AAV9J9C7_9PEZI|nr:hypothetical protein LTR36_007930 [Oleoguttula mirabilis]
MPPKTRSKSTVAKKPVAKPAGKTTPATKAGKAKSAKTAAAKVTKSKKPAKKAPAKPSVPAKKPATLKAETRKNGKVAKPSTTTKASPPSSKAESKAQLSVAEKAKAYHAELGAIAARLAAEVEGGVFFEVHMAIDPALEILYKLQ